MQYIISQDELNADLQRRDKLRKLPSIEKLQEFCTFVAETMILTEGWAKGRKHGCILAERARGEPIGYCDDCPAKDVCPYDNKEWSK